MRVLADLYVYSFFFLKQTLRNLKCFSAFPVAEIGFMTGTCVCVVLTHTGQVYLWPWMEDSDDNPMIVISDQDIVRISCGDEYG